MAQYNPTGYVVTYLDCCGNRRIAERDTDAALAEFIRTELTIREVTGIVPSIDDRKRVIADLVQLSAQAAVTANRC